MGDDSRLRAGDRVLVGTTLVTVDAGFAASLEPGDVVLGVAATGAVRRIPARTARLVSDAVSATVDAFGRLGRVDVAAVDAFFAEAGRLLADDSAFAPIAAANARDVADARSRGRTTTRLELTAKMRSEMVAAFRMWQAAGTGTGVVDAIDHDSWSVETWRAPLGVVGFVFEGRPNVFADATGVLRGGNAVVFRIGSDALGTARAIMSSVVTPALVSAGLPPAAVSLVESPEHAAGWALFSDPRLSLAVARGSGPAVAELGSIAQQAGVPVSLHGTGGAWMLVGESVDASRLAALVENSLDRKVCNTVNVVCIPRSRAGELCAVVVAAADRAASARDGGPARARLHAAGDAVDHLGAIEPVTVRRPDGDRLEERVTPIDVDDLGIEHEWEGTPEVSVVLVDSMDEAVGLFNEHSPRFIASVVTGSAEEEERAWSALDAPFVGDGFTRWVDGQFALLRPELGLSNWQAGRLFARGGILSGDSVFTVRLRARQRDTGLRR